MLESILILLGMFLSGFFYVEYARFRMRNSVKTIKNELKTELEGWLNSDKGQKAIYTIGVLLGNAIKQGVGLTAKGGKFKWEDIIGQAIMGFIQQKIPIIQQGEPQYG